MGTPTPLRARYGLDNLSNVIRNLGNESNVSASSAGAGALRINSNTLQISDGTNWIALPVTDTTGQIPVSYLNNAYALSIIMRS